MASLATRFKIETSEINTSGSAIGSTDRNRFGSSESRLSTIDCSSLVDDPADSRIGMLNLVSNHLAKNSTSHAGNRLAAKPAIIAMPKSSLRPSAIINGPGVGGTIECVIAPAPAIAIT